METANVVEPLDHSHPVRVRDKLTGAGVCSDPTTVGAAVGLLVRPLVHGGLAFLLVDLPADDGVHDAGDDVRMPVHVFSASGLRPARRRKPLSASSCGARRSFSERRKADEPGIQNRLTTKPRVKTSGLFCARSISGRNRQHSSIHLVGIRVWSNVSPSRSSGATISEIFMSFLVVANKGYHW